MNKTEYLDRLSRLLADISYEEHEEALSYYREYIEDAGIENEQQVLEELGSPEHLAQEIREGLLKKGEPGQKQGEPISAPELRGNDQSSYRSDYTDNNNNNNNSNHSSENYSYYNNNAEKKTNSEKNNSNTILLIILLILTSPIWFSLACTVFGCIVSILAIAVSIGAASIVCIITGIALIIAGFSALLSITVFSVSGTLVGAALIGAGLIVLSLGILFMVLTVWLFGWALPALVRFIRQTVSRISCKRKEAHV